jgi:surface-anchored protein
LLSLNAIGISQHSLTTLPFHELGYKWEFSDTSDSPEWAYGPTTANRKKNLAYGPVVGHVFEKPGTWTVKLTAVATNGKAAMAEKTLTVVVTDPASLGTVCVSNTTTPEAGKSGCPVGAAAQVVTSWTGMSSLANTYKRILLKRGDVCTFPYLQHRSLVS